MLRRNSRLRKEYLYRKSLEGKEKEYYDKKRKIKEALQGMSSQKSHNIAHAANESLLPSLHSTPPQQSTPSYTHLQRVNQSQLSSATRKPNSALKPNLTTTTPLFSEPTLMTNTPTLVNETPKYSSPHHVILAADSSNSLKNSNSSFPTHNASIEVASLFQN